MRVVFFTFISLFLVTSLYSQISNAFYFNGGLNFQNTKESRTNVNFRSGVGASIIFGYENQKADRIQNIEFEFDYASLGTSFYSKSISLFPALHYQYLKRKGTSNTFLGGYIKIGSLLNFRTLSWASTNGVTYTLWNSLGATARHQKTIQLGKLSVQWENRISFPLLAYLIRPSYVFSFPNNYINQEHYNLSKDGLAERVVTSGKIVPIGRFINLQFKTGLKMPMANDKWYLGLDYMFSYLQVFDTRSLYQFNNRLVFTIGKKLSKDEK